jgi:hypothetical protein
MDVFLPRIGLRPSRTGLLFLMLLLLTGWTPARAETDNSPQALERFFSSRTKTLPSPGIDFTVTAGFAVLQTGNPDSSGRYAMTSINVTNVAANIYRLDLQLEKPQPRETLSFQQPSFYTEQRTYYFWYANGRDIIFKVGGKRVTLPTGRKDVLRVDIHSPDTYTIDRETMLHNLTFNDGATQIVLQIRFK